MQHAQYVITEVRGAVSQRHGIADVRLIVADPGNDDMNPSL